MCKINGATMLQRVKSDGRRSTPLVAPSRTVFGNRTRSFSFSGPEPLRKKRTSFTKTLLRLITHLEDKRPVVFYLGVIFCVFLFGVFLGQFVSSLNEAGIELEQTNNVRTKKPKPPKPPKPISTFRQHFPDIKLARYHIKDSKKYNDTVSKDREICFVHVGKTAGSTVGCALGFKLHCHGVTSITPGKLPQVTTRLFHSDEYNCFDDSAYYLFVVRNPIDRLVSAFNYDRPKDGNWTAHLERKTYLSKTNVTQLHLDCPFDSIDNLARLGLSENGNTTDECKRRAGAFVEGTNYGVHSLWNYQFHLEGVPKNARIVTIRQNHLVNDWNSIEHLIGGVESILGTNQTVLLHQNKHVTPNSTGDQTKLVDEKYLSDESRALICEKLCNEIQVYRKILSVSINLNDEQVQQSMEEVENSCPSEASATSCHSVLPDITAKLIRSRGYDSNITLDVATHKITVGRLQIPVKSTWSLGDK